MKGFRWSWVDFFTYFIISFVVAYVVTYVGAFAISRAYVAVVNSKEAFADMKSCGDSC